MKIVLGGASGFVGRRLQQRFETEGWEVMPLGRPDFSLSEAALAERIDGADAVITVAGTPIDRRWSRRHKALLRSSRIDTTKKLVDAVALMNKKPECFISTSAIGLYPSKGWHNELGTEYVYDFLGELCLDWEAAATGARELGLRTVIFRLGIVLGRDGGMLKRMWLPFKLGLGGIVGDGRQYLSWIHIDDLCDAYVRALGDPQMRGIYNLVAPRVSTNRELTKTLGAVLHRPTLLPIPYWVLRLLFGEGAEVIAGGQWAVPKRLLDAGFAFRFQTLDDALTDLAAKKKRSE